jgi:hypothetical protein
LKKEEEEEEEEEDPGLICTEIHASNLNILDKEYALNKFRSTASCFHIIAISTSHNYTYQYFCD